MNAENYSGFEPVAWTNQNELAYLKEEVACYIYAEPVFSEGNIPLYLHPSAKMKPMTAEEMRTAFRSTNTAEPLCEGWPGLERFARAIERHHGISCVENAENYARSEPAAWMFETERGMTLFSEYEPVSGLYAEGTLTPLYLHPSMKMKPMTAEEMAYGFTEPRYSQWQAFVAGVKWSESHHGIGGSDEKGS